MYLNLFLHISMAVSAALAVVLTIASVTIRIWAYDDQRQIDRSLWVIALGVAALLEYVWMASAALPSAFLVGMLTWAVNYGICHVIKRLPFGGLITSVARGVGNWR